MMTTQTLTSTIGRRAPRWGGVLVLGAAFALASVGLARAAVADHQPLVALAATPAGDDQTEQAQLDDARARWRRQRAIEYRFRIQRICFCADARDPVIIRVRRGTPRNPPAAFRDVGTARRMFSFIQAAIDGKGAIAADYAPKTGFPTRIDSGPLPPIPDAGLGYRIDHLRIVRAAG
jgi:hypothetical protein